MHKVVFSCIGGNLSLCKNAVKNDWLLNIPFHFQLQNHSRTEILSYSRFQMAGFLKIVACKGWKVTFLMPLCRKIHKSTDCPDKRILRNHLLQTNHKQLITLLSGYLWHDYKLFVYSLKIAKTVCAAKR